MKFGDSGRSDSHGVLVEFGEEGTVLFETIRLKARGIDTGGDGH